MRWVGGVNAVTAMGKTFVSTRRTGEGRVVPTDIPDHINVIGDLIGGGQLSMQISSVTGLSGPGMEMFLFGSEGTLRFADGVLSGGRRGDDALAPIEIPADEAGGWRVEEEFIRAIRGQEEITHTSFEDGVRYMIFTEAVARSMARHRTVTLYEVAADAGG